MRKLWPGLVILVLSAAFGAVMFNRLPAQIVSHWGADGTPNGWSSRWVLVAGTPLFSIVIAIILAFAPQWDPKRYNFASHQGSYWLVANSSLILVAVCNALAISINVGWHVRVQWFGYLVGSLLIVMGNVLTRVRPNWIFGLRTPWALSSDRAWRLSHRVAGYGFVLLGIAIVASGAIHPPALVYVVSVGGAAVTIASILRGYFVWKNDSSITNPN